MQDHKTSFVLNATGATSIRDTTPLQELWSGYGLIERVYLDGADVDSVIVKDVHPPTQARHPRGWSSSRSHERKLESYRVEIAWYREWSQECDARCRVPHCFGAEQTDTGFLLVLEDLDAAGYPLRKQRLRPAELEACLHWLAHFHGKFLGRKPDGLWPQGSYWHLATRPDEWEVLDDLPLKRAAAAIDQALEASPFRTLLHGDAKVANFCFAASGRVAAVDFQYAGGGCGMKDLAYFLGSCLDEERCEQEEDRLLSLYFRALREGMPPGVDADALEADWRSRYPLAWADFHRFLKGWSPGHWKINSYSERICRQVIEDLSP